ncbi:MAG TPA: PilZ domain-containing protein [Pyrinomonadaceae bacterium]
MTNERRRNKRVPILVEIVWEGTAGRYQARTTDLSERGCFVDSVGHALHGEHVKFKLKLPSGEWLELEGDVTFTDPRIGFGVEFGAMSDEDRKKLQWFVKALSRDEDKKP